MGGRRAGPGGGHSVVCEVKVRSVTRVVITSLLSVSLTPEDGRAVALTSPSRHNETNLLQLLRNVALYLVEY